MKDFSKVRRGDLIRHVGAEFAYVADDAQPDRLLLVITVVAYNPAEWDRIDSDTGEVIEE